MRPSMSSKEAFVKYMLGQEEKLKKPFTDEEKILTWKAWQQCWCIAKVQTRREMKADMKWEVKKRIRAMEGKYEEL